MVYHYSCSPDVQGFTLENVIDYYPYGKILQEYSWNKLPERYLTTHHERDVESGLDYRGARYYDSDIGRFLSLDPLAVDYAAWSDYNYVLGNPIVFIDPTGRSSVYVDGVKQDMTDKDWEDLNSSIGRYFEGKKEKEEYLVDKELNEVGLDPNKKAEFSLESVNKVSKLKSIQKLTKLGANPKKIILEKGSGLAFTKGGIVTLYVKNFQSWRYLAASYGHELVHIINVNLYWEELYKAGYISDDGKFPSRYNELLAHSWSAEYSGIGTGAINFYMSQSKKKYKGLVEQFYQKQRIRP